MLKKLLALILLFWCADASAAQWQDPPLPPLPATGPAGAPIRASVTQPSIAGDIVGLKIQNTGASLMPAGYVTIGHVFRPGDVQAPHFTATIIGSVLSVSAIASGLGHIAVGQTLYIPGRTGAEG